MTRLAPVSAADSDTGLKEDAPALSEIGCDQPALNPDHNAPPFYAAPPTGDEQRLEALEDSLLAQKVIARSSEPSREITLDEL